MKRDALTAVGGLAFGILPMIGFAIANPPGGNYSASDAQTFIEKGHRPAVFLSVYVLLAGVVGLALVLRRLRASIDGDRGTLFTILGGAAVAAWVAGYALVIGVPVAFAFGGSGFVLSNSVIYAFAESGWAVMYGAGGTLLGLALLVFAAGRVTVPSWVRWTTLVAGVCALAGLAWFPMFLVFAWSIVLGVWSAVAGRATATRAVEAVTA